MKVFDPTTALKVVTGQAIWVGVLVNSTTTPPIWARALGGGLSQTFQGSMLHLRFGTLNSMTAAPASVDLNTLGAPGAQFWSAVY